jgi:serine protease Do
MISSSKIRYAFTGLVVAGVAFAGKAELPTRGFADVVEKDLPAVVSIYTTRVEKASATESQLGLVPGPKRRKHKSAGEGSGVIVESGGVILTNHHVVDKSTRITVHLSDEREFEAKVIASDPRTDLAVLQIEATGLPTVSFADSAKVRVGDYALAIGNPFGVGQTVTLGIVSATGRGNLGIEDYEDFIQTDAAINPGNSGGALVNAEGGLIGINTAIVSPEGANNGIGFAIPSNMARSVMRQLIENGRVTRGYLGIDMQVLTPQLAEVLGVTHRTGVLIADVAPDSPAAAGGVARGDVIIGINGKPINDLSQLKLFVGSVRPGSVVHIKVARGPEEVVLEVQLTERDEKAASPVTQTKEEDDIIDGAELSELTPAIRHELDLEQTAQGIVVTSLDPASDAAEAGLRPGDLISAVNRKPVTDMATLRSELGGGSGKSRLVEVLRSGSNTFVALPR